MLESILVALISLIIIVILLFVICACMIAKECDEEMRNK